MGGMETFTLVPRGPFSLAASIRFLEGFTPAWYSSPADGGLELAFPAEGNWRTVGVRVSQAGAEVNAAIVSPDEPGSGLVAEVRPQVERILALDVDGSGFPAVGERDPVAGELQRRVAPGRTPKAPEKLSWHQHVVASRVPPAVRQANDNQGGRDWTERRRDPAGRAGSQPRGQPGNT